METIIRNQILSDIFQVVENEDGRLLLTRPRFDYDMIVMLCDMQGIKCRGSQEQLESIGFARVGSATATKVHNGKVDVLSAGYFRGNLLFGNFYFHDIVVSMEETASRLQFILPKKFFTAIYVDLIHQTATLSMESNYVNVAGIIQQMNQTALEDLAEEGKTV